MAERLGCPSFLIDNKEEIDPDWLSGKARVGVTSGASAPENLVQDVVSHLQAAGGMLIGSADNVSEAIEFSLPRELREQ